MNSALELLKESGYFALFFTVLLDQLGVPLPSLPLLMAAGALVGLGHLSALPVLGVVVLASLLGDLFWYELGRRRGASILKFLCKVSLEPDSCVRTTEGIFDRYGDRCLIVAKFIPGLYTVTPPVAGMVGLPLARFLFYDTLGIVLWVGVYGGLGLALSDQLEWLLQQVERFGVTLFQVILGVLAVHLGHKFYWRQRFLHKLRTARITAAELKSKMDEGEEVWIADLRHHLDYERDPVRLPGALRMTMDEIEHRHREIPRDRDIILYCT